MPPGRPPFNSTGTQPELEPTSPTGAAEGQRERRQVESPRKKRQNVRIACNGCRKKKRACDGQRPTCRNCTRSGFECVYDTQEDGESRSTALQREVQATKSSLQLFNSMWHRLLSVPDSESIELLRELRNAAATPSRPADSSGLVPHEVFLNGVSEGSEQLNHLCLQYGQLVNPTLFGSLSEHTVRQALLPPLCSRLEYQLMISHSTLYPCFARPGDGKIPLKPLLVPDGQTTDPVGTQRLGIWRGYSVLLIAWLILAQGCEQPTSVYPSN